jgi:hypothetical protein
MNAPIPAGGGLRWTAVAAGAGLLLVGALTVLNRVELMRLAEANPAGAQDARLAALATRVAELAGEAEQSRKPSDAVPLARYETERGAVERRLAAVEQRLDERPASEGLDPLRDRLARLETRLAQHMKKPAAKTPARPASPPQPKTAEPSFRAIGIERRADERFLSILPQGTDGLSQVRLLRVGDTEDGWQLEAIEDEAATFVQGNKKHRLNLMPENRP